MRRPLCKRPGTRTSTPPTHVRPRLEASQILSAIATELAEMELLIRQFRNEAQRLTAVTERARLLLLAPYELDATPCARAPTTSFFMPGATTGRPPLG